MSIVTACAATASASPSAALPPNLSALLAVQQLGRDQAVLAALNALETGFELITLYYGAGVDPVEAEDLAHRVREWRPGVEVEVIRGGQPHYRYLIAAE